MFQDFRYAFRVLASRPGFTLVAAISLALGIGANAAIFSVVDTFWFRPLAVPNEGRVVRVVSTTNQEPEGLWFSYAEYLQFAGNVPALRDVVAVGGRGISFVAGDEKQLLLMNLVSPDFFTALAVKPAAGRLFTSRDEASGGLLVVLGNSFWHRQFGGDPAIVGKQIRLQRAHEALATVIGVLPASFRDTETGGGDRDVWFSLPAWRQLGDASELENRNFRWFRVLARLAPGATVASANAQVQALGMRMAADSPESNRGRRAGGRKRHGYPDVGRKPVLKDRSNNAHDIVAFLVDLDILADDGCIGAVFPFPQFLGYNRNMVPAKLFLFSAKKTTEKGLHTKHWKDAGRHVHERNDFWPAVTGERKSTQTINGPFGREARGHSTKVEDFWWCYGDLVP
jgi:MacB-like protein